MPWASACPAAVQRSDRSVTPAPRHHGKTNCTAMANLFNRMPKKHRAGRKGKKAPPHHKLYNRSLLHGPLTSSKIKTATAGAYVHGLYNGCLEDMLLVCMKGASCLRALHLVHGHCTNSDQKLMSKSSPRFPTAAGAAVGSQSTLMSHASLPVISSSTRSSHARG